MVRLKREGHIKDVELLLKNRQNNYAVITREEVEMTEKLGALFEEISAEDKQNLGLDYGMQIVELQRGKLMDKGIREGFIITEIDKTPVRSANDIQKLLNNKRGGVLIEGVYPNGQRNYYAIGM
jgi:hypothetical protein